MVSLDLRWILSAFFLLAGVGRYRTVSLSSGKSVRWWVTPWRDW